MRFRKQYGQSRIEKCPFCQMHATTKNQQGVPVCSNHKNTPLPEMKCVCGEYLDLMEGKFGIFFSCPKCGNMNAKRVFELNPIKPATNETKQETKHDPEPKKEITIRSDDPDYFS